MLYTNFCIFYSFLQRYCRFYKTFLLLQTWTLFFYNIHFSSAISNNIRYYKCSMWLECVCVCVEHTKWGRYSTVVNSSPRHFLTTTKLYHLNECSGGKITNQVVAHKISRVKENFGVKKCLTENLTLSYILTKVLFQK